MLPPKKSNKKPLPAKKYNTSAGDSLAEDIFEILDPTGISSYDDVYRSYKDNGLLSWQTGLEVLGALPIIGKAGKGIKIANTSSKLLKGLSKTNKITAKVEKVLPAILKEGKNFGKIVQKTSRVGKANPVGAGAIAIGLGAQGLEKVAKVIQKGTKKGVKEVIKKTPSNKRIINEGIATLNSVNTLSDATGLVKDQIVPPVKNKLINPIVNDVEEIIDRDSYQPITKTVYYNTDPKRGEVEKPGTDSTVKYIPVTNSVQFKKWKEQKLAYGTGEEGIEDPPSTMFKKPSIVDYIEPKYSYPVRDKLYPGEEKLFKERPDVGGMAAEDNSVIINPYSSLSDDEKDLVKVNETARLAMRNGYRRPTFELTPKQQEFFSTIQNGKPYSEDLQDIRETIAARVMTGDPSAQDYTKEQEMYANQLWDVLKRSKNYSENNPDTSTGMMKSQVGLQNIFSPIGSRPEDMGIREITDFEKAYVNSPRFAELSKKQGDTPEMTQKRKNTINNFNVDKDVIRVSEGPSYISADEEGTPKFYLSPDKGDWPSHLDINAHEMGHFPYNTGDLNFPENTYREIQSRNKEFIKSKKTGVTDENIEHDINPNEVRADKNQLLYQLKKLGIYDATKDGDINQKQLNEFKDSGEWNRLQRLYDDADILWLINNVAQNTPNEEMSNFQYGTNPQGIMKNKMNPRKKYANGSNVNGVTPNNYIVTPAQAINDYNIMLAKSEAEALSNDWLPIVAAAGNLLQQGVSAYGKYNLEKKSNKKDEDAAMGMNNVQKDVEVEGGEMYETPQGEVGQFEGPSHAEGGIPLEVTDTPVADPNQGEVQKETKVYSKDLKIAGKSLADRKATRERKTANLEKIASNNLADVAVKNAAKRKMMAIQKEEAADLQFQEQVNNMQAMADTMVEAFAYGTSMAGIQDNPIGDSMRYGYGSGMKGIKKYDIGTDEEGIGDPPYGVDNPMYGDEDNKIKNVQMILGVTPTGKALKKTKAAWNAYQVPGYNPPKKGVDYKYPWEGTKEAEAELYTAMGLTPAGRQFKKPLTIGSKPMVKTSTAADLLQQSVDISNIDKELANQVANAKKLNKKQNQEEEKNSFFSNLLSSMPGAGDMTKLLGNYFGMTAGIKTANEQRSTDVPFSNPFERAGIESQRLLDNAKRAVDVNKAQAIVKNTTMSRGGKKGARGSARGVNQMRSTDWLYDTALQQQTNEIMSNAFNQMSQIDLQKSQVALNTDQLRGEGKIKADMLNEAAKDAYYTALGLGRKDFATGLQQSGKDLNEIKTNQLIEKMMENYGDFVTMEGGKLVAKKKKTTPKNNKGVIEVEIGGKKYKLTKDQIENLTLES